MPTKKKSAKQSATKAKKQVKRLSKTESAALAKSSSKKAAAKAAPKKLPGRKAAAKAIQMSNDITATADVGKTYLGRVTRLADFGAFVEILPGTDGPLDTGEAAEHRINDVRDELKEGDQVLVKVLTVDGNRIKLSRKAVLREQRAGGTKVQNPRQGTNGCGYGKPEE